MTEAKNTTPAHIWEVLRRLLNCNKKQLATRLGVSPRTLRDWEALTESGQQPGKTASQMASQLLIATLRAADNSDVYAQLIINWDAVYKIGGRR